MTPVSATQLTLSFEPSLPERFKSLRAYVGFRVQEQRLHAATLAADMDLSPSTLSRKLNQPEGDTQRFNCDDLEAYIAATRDISVIEYLVSKYMDTPEARKVRAIARVETLAAQLQQAMTSLKEAA